jgi:hypothetical protein
MEAASPAIARYISPFTPKKRITLGGPGNTLAGAFRIVAQITSEQEAAKADGFERTCR